MVIEAIFVLRVEKIYLKDFIKNMVVKATTKKIDPDGWKYRDKEAQLRALVIHGESIFQYVFNRGNDFRTPPRQKSPRINFKELMKVFK